ncbi:hypothetical protein M758_5G084600 [Ceratodon purpureus]|nr:hypothetical protein M758_5G084600 [Ceratodon purpureus]
MKGHFFCKRGAALSVYLSVCVCLSAVTCCLRQPTQEVVISFSNMPHWNQSMGLSSM